MKISARRSPAARHSRRRHRLLVSCEHGGNRVPAEYAPLFKGAARVLDSHRGCDHGALDVARALGKRLGVRPETATVSRLLCDLNRSPHHRGLFSEYTRPLSQDERARVLRRYYWPYRQRVEAQVAEAGANGEGVVHVSSHSFAPVLRGEVRRCDVGFLYDPSRPGEVDFVDAWRTALTALAPSLVVRRNYPYKGVSDGLVTYLRRRYGRHGYVGVELEVNQKHVGRAKWHELVETLAASLAAAIEVHSGLPR